MAAKHQERCCTVRIRMPRLPILLLFLALPLRPATLVRCGKLLDVGLKFVPSPRLLEIGLPSLGRPVLDRTGLTGTFDFAVEFSPQPDEPSAPDANFRPDPTGPTFEQALKEQLGLKLESQMGPADFLVIDYIETHSAN